MKLIDKQFISARECFGSNLSHCSRTLSSEFLRELAKFDGRSFTIIPRFSHCENISSAIESIAFDALSNPDNRCEKIKRLNNFVILIITTYNGFVEESMVYVSIFISAI